MAMRGTNKQLDLSDVKNRCPATIGFRLGEGDGEVLMSRATALGVSAHDLARVYTQQALREKEERANLWSAIQKLHTEIAELRKDILVSTAVLLSSAGKVEADEAQTWVEENLGGS